MLVSRAKKSRCRPKALNSVLTSRIILWYTDRRLYRLVALYYIYINSYIYTEPQKKCHIYLRIQHNNRQYHKYSSNYFMVRKKWFRRYVHKIIHLFTNFTTKSSKWLRINEYPGSAPSLFCWYNKTNGKNIFVNNLMFFCKEIYIRFNTKKKTTGKQKSKPACLETSHVTAAINPIGQLQ
jgi:hypothetical protein